MRTLAIDIETFSSVDLARCGVHRYSEAADFTILLLGYAFDDRPVQVVDLANGERVPDAVLVALVDPEVIKTAYNAQFERTCLARYFSKPMQPEQWRCSQVHALALGLPGNLATVARALNLPQQKLPQGQSLIKYFSVPCQPSKANGGRTRNLPHHDYHKWQTFKAYCGQDVVVEREIRSKLKQYPLTVTEQQLWCLDQRINDGGVRVDGQLVGHAIYCGELHHRRMTTEACQLTGLSNPNSPVQLKGWLHKEHQIEVESLAKEMVAELLPKITEPSVRRVLQLRQELSKTSTKKYQAMVRAVGKDQRIKGLLQFYGASRTGRWAGRLVQVHNLPKNNLQQLKQARQLLRAGDYKGLEQLADSLPKVLSQLIRTAFIPSANCHLLVADFSAIEARVIAWLAIEDWRLEVFKGDGKIYEASAAQMFRVPLAQVTKDSPLRQKGKIAELALGYQGGTGALKTMGALKMGLPEAELPKLVASWRLANLNIVKLWQRVERAAITAVKEQSAVTMQYGLTFYYQDGVLFIKLPSGRCLAYFNPRMERDHRFNQQRLTYEGIEQGSKTWGRISTYGGKLVENIVQAIARDCLAEAMLRLDAAGYKIVFHVHDEVILDVPRGFGSLTEVEQMMALPLAWAPGLPLRAEGFETDYYMKN